MNKKYKIDRIVNDRYAVWRMDFEEEKNKLGIYRIIDLYKGNRDTRFSIRWKARGNKDQEQLDTLAIENGIKRFGNIRVNRYVNKRVQTTNL